MNSSHVPLFNLDRGRHHRPGSESCWSHHHHVHCRWVVSGNDGYVSRRHVVDYHGSHVIVCHDGHVPGSQIIGRHDHGPWCHVTGCPVVPGHGRHVTGCHVGHGLGHRIGGALLLHSKLVLEVKTGPAAPFQRL